MEWENIPNSFGVELRVALDPSMNSSRRLMKMSYSSGVSMEEVLSAGQTIGRVYRSVIGFFMMTRIILPLYLTTHFLMSNLTVHPASVSTRITKREAIDNSGTMCPTGVVRRPGIMMSHMCVDIIQRPSANTTLSGHIVFCLLWTNVPSKTKIWVAPESAIPSFDACNHPRGVYPFGLLSWGKQVECQLETCRHRAI